MSNQKQVFKLQLRKEPVILLNHFLETEKNTVSVKLCLAKTNDVICLLILKKLPDSKFDTFVLVN